MGQLNAEWQVASHRDDLGIKMTEEREKVTQIIDF
jgi:hypothetical protein